MDPAADANPARSGGWLLGGPTPKKIARRPRPLRECGRRIFCLDQRPGFAPRAVSSSVPLSDLGDRMTEDAAPTIDHVGLTADLVTAYVANNAVDAAALPGLIASIHATLTGLGSADGSAETGETHTPAVSVRKSLASPDHIVSLIDGKPYKALTRHLSTHGLTPEEYRARYGLPASYPMVAPAYSEKRSALAKALGFGRKPKAKAPAKAAAKPGRKPRAKAEKSA